MIRLARLLLFVVALMPAAAFAQSTNLTGTYIVEGQNAGAKGSYRGELAIAPSGDTFRVVWRIGNQQHEGTGLLRDGKLAVVFRSSQQTGVALYDVRDNGTLIGTWTTLGSRAVGTETLTPKGRI
jgi:hypothetical protein